MKNLSTMTKMESVLLFLFAIAFLNLSGYIFAGILLLFLVLDHRRIRISVSELILFFFGASYFIFHIIHYEMSIHSVILYFVGPLGAFILGKSFAQRESDLHGALWLLVVLGLGMFAHGVLNWVAYVRSDYSQTYSYLRWSVDFWRKDKISVTITGMLYTFAAVTALATLFTSAPKRYKLFAGIVLLIGVALTVYFANRTLLCVLAIIGGASFVKWFVRAPKRDQKRCITWIVVVTCCLMAFLASRLGAGLRTWLSSLKLIERMQQERTVDPRLVAWVGSFKDLNFVKHWYGGGYLLAAVIESMSGLTISYFHNLWLDTYNEVGVVTFLLLMYFTFYAISRYRRCRAVYLRHGRRDEVVIFDCWGIAVLLNCCVEPVIQGNPYFFLMVLMVLGAMEGETSRAVETEGRYRR